MERAVAALANGQAIVQVAAVATEGEKPRGLEALFELERMLLRRGVPGGADALPIDAIAARHRANGKCDVVIDFASPAPGNGASRTLTPLYDGVAGEDGVLAAVVAGELPRIDIQDSARGGIVASGRPSAENAAGLSGALDTVMACTLTLLARVLAGGADADAATEPSRLPRAAASPAPYVMKGLAAALAREIYRLCCYAPHWRVGWRHVDDGGVWERGDLSGPSWNVVPDPGVRFYADPFAATREGRTFVFVEELDHRVGKGFISAIEFGDDGPKGLARPVLEEPWHLSYPFLIEEGGQLFMIPESMGNRDVAIYKCIAFPDRWERVATLLSDVELSDATIVRRDGTYYLFGALWDGTGGYSDTLAIYHAPGLLGPWLPHAANPVLIDRSAARPAGHFVHRDGRLWRPVQDCAAGYGSALVLAEVTELSPTSFRQTVHKTVRPGQFWPGRKLHTLNRISRLELIDGSVIQPKPVALLKSLRATS
jgi:hypothetical protein